MLLFILSWAIKQLIFAYWLYLLIKHCFFVFLSSMITDNLVEIRFPKIQSRKCLRKFNFNEIRSPELSAAAYHKVLPQPKDFFFLQCLKCSLLLAYCIFDILLVVVFFSLCNLLLSVSRAALLT